MCRAAFRRAGGPVPSLLSVGKVRDRQRDGYMLACSLETAASEGRPTKSVDGLSLAAGDSDLV